MPPRALVRDIGTHTMVFMGGEHSIMLHLAQECNELL